VVNRNALTLTVTPACAAKVNSRCPGRDARTPVVLHMSYDFGSNFFIQTFRAGVLQVTIPQMRATYDYQVMVEPHT
jgi:hypothetical protein